MSVKDQNRCGTVAIVGRPNVGKSTLLNALLGVRLAITSHKAQTTRHTILGVNTLAAGQLIYIDTPGLHQRGDEPFNRYLNRTALSALQDVDLVLFVVESLVWTDEDKAVASRLAELGASVVVAVNKIDKVKGREALLPYLQQVAQQVDAIELVPVSAEKKEQLDRLETCVLAGLPVQENIFPEDQLTDRSSRFLASEFIREQLTRRYAAELPYAVTVEIDAFEEDGELTRISATIWVEKTGQKKILLGKKGAAIKEVGKQARLQMEELLGTRVFLQLWVKVKGSWSSDLQALKQLGYGD